MDSHELIGQRAIQNNVVSSSDNKANGTFVKIFNFKIVSLFARTWLLAVLNDELNHSVYIRDLGLLTLIKLDIEYFRAFFLNSDSLFDLSF